MLFAKKESQKPLQEKLNSLRLQLESKILGQPEAVEFCLAALLSGGHVLLEGPPGVGKTSLAQGVAQLFQGIFHRIQLTSDLLPSDIVGTLRMRPGAQDFEFRKGPIFTQVLLADELNRTSTRTQAALLEAMAEGKVTVDGITYDLPNPFFVVATQNPEEFQGVYPLSESQLDRFMVQVLLDFPHEEEEKKLYQRYLSKEIQKFDVSALTSEEIASIKKEVRNVHVAPELLEYAQKTAQQIRRADNVIHGASVRAVLQWIDAARAIAYLDGRDFTHPEDFRRLAPAIFAHKIFSRADLTSAQKRELVSEAMDRVVSPK